MSETGSGIGRRRESARRERSAAWLEKRAEILVAAAEVFRRKGFNGTSITDIAGALGINQSNVYYYFAKKEEIFLELVRQAVDSNVTAAETIARRRRPAAERLAAVVESLAHSYEEHFPFMQLYVQEDLRWIASSSDEAGLFLRDGAHRFETAVLKIVRQGIRSGELRADLDPQLVTYGVLGTVNWMHRWYNPKSGLRGDDIGHTFSRLVLEGLFPPRP